MSKKYDVGAVVKKGREKPCPRCYLPMTPATEIKTKSKGYICPNHGFMEL